MKINLKANPFYLNAEQEKWVLDTLNNMSMDEKFGQLFCPSFNPFNPREVNHLLNDIHIGAAMIRPFGVKGLKDAISNVQKQAKIPLLISANLENGGSGAINEGTMFANPMGCAATNDPEFGYRLGKVSTSEASAVGVNWGYAPIIDVDLNYHNPITNVRTFGNDVDRVIAFARNYIKAAKEENVLPTIKHFPGDGIDERDQHLLVSINSLSYEDYMKISGKAYKTLIEEGAPTIMVGHIAAPNVARHINPAISAKEACTPATMSKELITGFLRNELGFNGLVVTDSTLMVGYMASASRRVSIPSSIESGVDMILFDKSIDEDLAYLKDGFAKGLVSKERIDEAVTRILASKAKLNLFETCDNDKDPQAVILKNKESGWVEECADKAITLVKDNEHLLPLDSSQYRRMYLNVIETVTENDTPFALDIKERFEKMGFEVTLRRRKMPEITPAKLFSGQLTLEEKMALADVAGDTESFKSKYDIACIVVNMETASNNTVLRVNWKVLFGMGNDIPWYAGEMPLLVMSVSNPYHLLDIPMASAYVNTYTNNKATIDALFEKISGKSPFKGVSPIDPFCGHEDTKI